MSPKIRRWAAGILVILAAIGWPITQFTVAKDEPPFTLALSWGAILLTGLDILATTDVRTKEEEDEQT